MAVPIIVTAIQLGTKACSFAYQFKSDLKKEPVNIRSYMFSTGTGQRTDFPSALLTTDGYRGATVVEDFGYRAIERFKGIVDDNNKYGFFENIIEALYTSELCQTYPHEISMKIRCTTLTLPDAALTYYLYLPPERCNTIDIDRIRIGERVMVIGFEEELDSFNIYEKKEKMKFKQIVHFLSGTSSRCLILKAFDTFFEDLIGSWIWKVAKQYCIDLWQDIVSKIDKLMESKMDTDYMVTFSLSFIDLEKICAENTNMSLKQILETSEFSTKINYGQMKLRVESVLIKSLFDKCLSKIIREIQHVLVKSDDKEVTTLILAGNIARSGLLIHAIQKAFPSKQIAVSDEANEVALKGAVLFGQLPIVVSSIFSGAQVMVAPKKGHITKVPL